MRQAFKIVLMTLVAMALLSSCIFDDRSDCPPPQEVHTLKLKFMPPDVGITPTQTDLKKAVVYIFDSAGEQFGTWSIENPVLNTTYDTGIILGNDTYRLVVWFNPDDPYTITPGYTVTPQPPVTRSDLSDGRVTLDIPQSGDMTEDIPMLLYGSAERMVAPIEDIAFDIPLTVSTYHINVTLKGIPLDGSTYRLQISDMGGYYDFYNNFIATSEVDYIDLKSAGTGGGTGDLMLSLCTMALDESRAPMLSIVNTTTGKTVFPQNGAPSVNLMDLIRQTGVDIRTIHLIEIEVPPPSTDGVSTTIDVYINGWHIVIDDYGINPYE